MRTRGARPLVMAGAIALVSAVAGLAVRPAAGAEAFDHGAARRRAIRSACALAPEQLRRIEDGIRADRSGEIQVVPAEPDYLDGGLMHAGPWDYLQEVPVLWYGPGFVRDAGRVDRRVTVADIAPTQAALLGFDGFDAPDGSTMTEALPFDAGEDPPKLLVTLVWDAAGRNVLTRWPDSWPTLAGLVEDGTWYERAEVGSSPSNTPPIHASIGTGAFPDHHGIVDVFMRVGDGPLIQPMNLGPGNLLEPTLADVYDRALGNEPVVGAVATLSGHLGFLGHGSMWGGGDKDVAVTRELIDAAVGGSEGPQWNLAPSMARWYRFPAYVLDVGGYGADVDAVDRSDGEFDRAWHGDPFTQLNAGFDSPARIPYQTRVIQQVLRREGFGRDRVPDLLFLNYKAMDRVGHLFSVDSPQMRETLEAQDEYLRVLIDELDRTVGEGDWAMVITADHGHQFDPEVSGAFRISISTTQDLLEERFDDGDDVKLFDKVKPTQVWLDESELQRNGHPLLELNDALLSLTQAQTAASPELVHDPDALALAAAFPTDLLDELPCAPEGDA
ncbi:MAG: alkaline phosphatase family protein [Actinomycetota bacterium]